MAYKIFNKYWWIARQLRTNQLQKKSSDELKFSETDLFNMDIGQRGGNFFLGYYSEEGIIDALKKYGVYKLLKRKGFNNLITIVDTSDIYKHRLSIYFNQRDVNHLLIEIVLRKEFINIKLPFQTELENHKFETLKIDWLCMQNPLKLFDSNRLQLPGQKYPGLGFSNVAIEILMIISWRLNLAALLNIPEHFHNAYFYSKIFHYINPYTEAKFLALVKEFKNYHIAKITWAIEWECIIDIEQNKPFVWMPDHQIVPIDTKLKKIFYGKEYRKYINNHKKSYKFKFDEEKYIYMKNRISKNDMENII